MKTTTSSADTLLACEFDPARFTVQRQELEPGAVFWVVHDTVLGDVVNAHGPRIMAYASREAAEHMLAAFVREPGTIGFANSDNLIAAVEDELEVDHVRAGQLVFAAIASAGYDLPSSGYIWVGDQFGPYMREAGRLYDAAEDIEKAMLTTSEIAERWGMSVAPADNKLRRLGDRGVRPVGRQPGRAGQNLWVWAAVQKALAQSPGRGARTDLQTGHDDTEEAAS